MATTTQTVDASKDTAKQLVRYQVDSGVAVITLDDPPANTYTYEMNRQLDEAILRARFDNDVARHAGKASRAAATAACNSSEVAKSTSCVCSPVAGLKTGPVRPDSPSTVFPPIQWLMRLMPVRSSTGGAASSVMSVLLAVALQRN